MTHLDAARRLIKISDSSISMAAFLDYLYDEGVDISEIEAISEGLRYRKSTLMAWLSLKHLLPSFPRCVAELYEATYVPEVRCVIHNKHGRCVQYVSFTEQFSEYPHAMGMLELYLSKLSVIN